jgi:CubicO group peptidase (beta-lactamase class C family)
MLPPRLLLRLVVVLFLAGVASRAHAAADPASLGFDPERLKRLDAVVQHHVDQKQLAGGVVYIARNGQTAHLKAYGHQDVEAGLAMPTDAIFRIASMSKAITSVAVMMLYEEGKLMLRDPLHKHLPAFRNQVVAVPAPKDAPPGTKFVTEPVRRPIQIRDLLAHTAGLTYGDGPAVDLYKAAGLHGWYFADKNETIGEAINRLATLPLHGHPGESWQYGYATDVLGHLVEVLSGLPLDRFIEERICRPLGMKDTSFFLPPGKEGRLAPVYGIEGGRLVRMEDSSKSDYVQGPRKCFSGGAGLLSTIQDYGRFLQMLANGGELDGVRLLNPRTVALMHENHTGDLYRRDTAAFGLGFWVNNDPGFYGELSNRGAYGWGSAYFPQYLVDPEKNLVAIFMTQLRPTGGLDLNQKFKVLTYQALMD